MSKFSHLIPAEHLDKVVDHGTHVVIGGEVFITDNEEIAIAIIDSNQSDPLVVLQHEPDKFTCYSGYGIDEGGQGIVEHYVSAWLD